VLCAPLIQYPLLIKRALNYDLIFTFQRVHFTKFEEFENYVKSKTNTQKKNNKSMTNSRQLKVNNLFPSNIGGLKQTQYENNLVNFIVNNMKPISITENKDFQKLILGKYLF